LSAIAEDGEIPTINSA